VRCDHMSSFFQHSTGLSSVSNSSELSSCHTSLSSITASASSVVAKDPSESDVSVKICNASISSAALMDVCSAGYEVIGSSCTGIPTADIFPPAAAVNVHLPTFSTDARPAYTADSPSEKRTRHIPQSNKTGLNKFGIIELFQVSYIIL
jgi:hypothetical protein